MREATARASDPPGTRTPVATSAPRRRTTSRSRPTHSTVDWPRSAAPRCRDRRTGRLSDQGRLLSPAPRAGPLEVLDLGGDLACRLFGVGEEHRGVRFVEEVVVDAGEAGAERALDHDHLLGLGDLD